MARGFNARSRSSFRGFRGNSTFRGRGRGRGRGGSHSAPKQDDEGTRLAERFEQVQVYDDIDSKLGFTRILEGPKKEGWLVNMHPVECNFSIQTWSARRVVWPTQLPRLIILVEISIETKFLKLPWHVLTEPLC
jgi:hypothetical protein